MEPDLTKATAPKSDQLNADDLIGISKTIKITKVSGTTDDKQPVAIYFEGDNGKPYKPCKSMTRVLIRVWGIKASEFVGRSMTLYRDDRVVFGGIEVGGIRISHMSHMDADVTMSLTASRASRKPYTVKQLRIDAQTEAKAPEAAQKKSVTSALNSQCAALAKEIEMAETGDELSKIEVRCNELAAALIEAGLLQSHEKLMRILEDKRGSFGSANPMFG